MLSCHWEPRKSLSCVGIECVTENASDHRLRFPAMVWQYSIVVHTVVNDRSHQQNIKSNENFFFDSCGVVGPTPDSSVSQASRANLTTAPKSLSPSVAFLTVRPHQRYIYEGCVTTFWAKMPSSKNRSCQPPSGHTYLTIGQDLLSIQDYVMTQYNASLHRHLQHFNASSPLFK